MRWSAVSRGSLLIAGCFGLSLLSLACPTMTQPQIPPGGSEPLPTTEAPVAVAMADAGPVAPTPTATGAAGADAPCSRGADCQSGVCEGKGCGVAAGRCAPIGRGCTRDRRPYCGCDGTTFFASGTCPGQLYAYPGRCQGGTGAGLLDDGGGCSAADECKSGVCEGLGCGGDQPGLCVPRDRRCTADSVPYCGCDGETFEASTTCPATRYRARGACS